MINKIKLAALALGAVLGTSAVAAQNRNVILIVGDGMDDHQITIARNYIKGARGKLTMDSLPMRGVSQVLTVAEDGSTPIYVADSANSATAMATGQVTSRARIAIAADGSTSFKTIAEMAHAAGFKTGIVASASVTDATPASFMAHINLRYCENPDLMENVEFSGISLGECSQHTKANGGLGSISQQIAESDIDVVLGGGMKHFEAIAEGESVSVLDVAKNNNYHVVTEASELAGIPADSKLLGLFAPSHLPVLLQGENGRSAEKPKPSWAHYIFKYFGSVELPEPMNCEPNPAFAGTPPLKLLTETALGQLTNDQGFFLMVESASIDKQSHERMPCGSIGEVKQLNEVIDSALAFAEKHPNTLILITADHGQAAQMIPQITMFDAFGIPAFSQGHMARINTPEGSIMGVAYATNDFFYEEHTGTNVPVFSNSEGIGRVPTMITQPEIFEIARDYLGL
jgi:alkaline phosphatase